MKTDPQRTPMVHNPDRKPQTPKDTTQVRQETSWGDGWDHNRESILRGARPQFDRESPKAPPPPPVEPLPIAVPTLPDT